MTSIKRIKLVLVAFWAVAVCVWLIMGAQPIAVEGSPEDISNSPAVITAENQDDYVGSESCKACHEEAFNSYAQTKHAKLNELEDWRDKAQGCESCHGPGREHVEAGGDIAKIISFKDKSQKQISESCLTCHQSNVEHANFRRGDHWRNNVGCTDCHTAHGPSKEPLQISSAAFPTRDTDIKPGTATQAMLKVSEPNLCISCHTSTKADFSKPFRHKVMEGQMNCSDCHSPHGGFGLKNARLAVGGDVACIKCHTEKQGPFVYEHLPITTEGCATCHSSHGSTNPKMMKRNQVRQLCLECHSSIFNSLTPNLPGFHNLNTRFSDCTTCHVKIHGSQNHPYFFR